AAGDRRRVRHHPRASAADRGASQEAPRRLPARADPRHQGDRDRLLRPSGGPMPMHGGRIVARALKQEGLPYIFTLCGGPVMSVYEGWLDEGHGVNDVRPEQCPGHPARGWGHGPRPPGAAQAPPEPAVLDAVTGVAPAWRANIPMVIIGGQAPRLFQDMGGLQDMNHVDLMRPITKWAVSVPSARRLGEYVSTAFRVATTNVPGPVFLEMP